MADLLFKFDQTSKAVANSTLAKQLNLNKINRRSAIVQGYFSPLYYLPSVLWVLPKILAWGAAIAQWIRLRLPSCRPGLESQAYQLSFYKFIIVWKRRK